MADHNFKPVFDYKTIRLFMGLIALTLAFIVSIISSTSLPSVSASYHTEARDVFVGMLVVVGTFLWAYNGHTPTQFKWSKVASVAAILVALCPTACSECSSSSISTIHVVAAVTLFSILAYFCFGPFREKTKGQGGKRGRRSRIYFACGCVMVGSMLIGLIAKLTLSDETLDEKSIIYWVEAFALGAFGVAWLVAGKFLKVLTDDVDLNHLRFPR